MTHAQEKLLIQIARSLGNVPGVWYEPLEKAVKEVEKERAETERREARESAAKEWRPDF